MTELNQRISAITREIAETGEPVRVTNRGRVVLRLVPVTGDALSPIESVIAAGLATPPTRARRGLGGAPIELSTDIETALEGLDRDW